MVASWQRLGERLHEDRPNKIVERERPWSMAPENRFMFPQLGTRRLVALSPRPDKGICESFVNHLLTFMKHLELAEGHNSLFACVLESDCDVPAPERTRAGDIQLSLECPCLGTTNVACCVGDWWAGVSDRYVKISQSIGCR